MGLGWDGILDMMVVQGSYDLIRLWPLLYGENLCVISIKLWHRIIIPTEVPVPGHRDFKENEPTDEQAKSAAQGHSSDAKFHPLLL